MGQRDDRGVAVGLDRDHRVVGHGAKQRRARHLEAGGVFLARVTDQHLVAQRVGHLRQVLRHLAGADQQQPPMRAVVGRELGVGQREFIGVCGGLERDLAAGDRQHPAHPLALAQAGQQFIEPGVRQHRLEHQLDQPAAGQAEAVRGVSVDAVAQHLRQARGQHAAARLVDQVVLDATARHAARDQSVVAHRDRRSRRPRRRAPGACDGAQHHAVAGRHPLGDLAQHIQVDVVHGVEGQKGLKLCGLRWLTACPQSVIHRKAYDGP